MKSTPKFSHIDPTIGPSKITEQQLLEVDALIRALKKARHTSR